MDFDDYQDDEDLAGIFGMGAGDVDDWVHFCIFFDSTPSVGLTEFFHLQLARLWETLEPELDAYMWHRDPWLVEPVLAPDSNEPETDFVPHLSGRIRFGDNVEDEWFVVHLMMRLTHRLGDATARVFDNDGDFLLMEAALQLPSWVSPTTSTNRAWIRDGCLNIVPRSKDFSGSLTLKEGLAAVRVGDGSTVARPGVQKALQRRLQGYPEKAVSMSTHMVRAVLPRPWAVVLSAFPQLVSSAVDHLPPDTEGLGSRRLPEKAKVSFQATEMSLVNIRLTRCQHARLQCLRMRPPAQFSLSRWPAPPGTPGDSLTRPRVLGANLCLGLKCAYMLDSRSAAMGFVRAAGLAGAAMATELQVAPWQEILRNAPVPLRAAADMAYRSLEMAAVRSVRSEMDRWFVLACASKVTLQAHAKDDDDSWMEVSMEELDASLQERAKEMEEFHKCREQRKGSRGSAGDTSPTSGASDDAFKPQPRNIAKTDVDTQVGPAQKAEGGKSVSERQGVRFEEPPVEEFSPEEDEELRAVGEKVKSLMLKVSSLEGVEGDTHDDGGSEGDDSDDSGHSGASPGDSASEDGEADPELLKYMRDLDTELEGVECEEGAAEDMPNSSHVRVDLPEVQLDSDLLANLLQSYCSETQLQPGPASVLFRELGLSLPG
mmetsp:Transcript_46667/g.101424  ORF Transcript_46667/g.101424 Transcript_46667/m.101424 type:complete len:657 (+) Transcript_46667:73-2043(+)